MYPLRRFTPGLHKENMTAGARASASGDAHVANATASTLNYALGRRHMKSWMTGAVNGAPAAPPDPTRNSVPSPVRKRGRPRRYPPPDVTDQQHATEAVSPTTAPSAERLPSSNSTSPQLDNVVTTHQRNPSRGSAEITVLPSPTPSEDDAHDVEVQSGETGPQQRANLGGFEFRPLQSPSASSPPRATGPKSPVGHGLAAPKRPAEENPVPVDKRARIDTAARPQPGATASTPVVVSPSTLPPFSEFPRHTSAPRAQHGSPSLGQASSRSPSLGRASNGQRASPQLLQAQHLGRPPSSRSNPSPVQGQHIQSSPAHQSHVSPPLNAQPFGVPPDTHAQQAVQPHRVFPSQRRASYHDEWYSLEACLQILSTFRARSVATRSRRDGERLTVLEEAVREQDWAYLTLHQYYCLMTHSPQSLPPSLSLQCNGNLRPAYLLMREVLDDNLQLSAPFMGFFCTFPFAIEYLASTWPARFRHAERDFVQFVNNWANVGQLRHVSESRKIPPTPREFANCAITSLTFQRLLLRSIIRSLWGGYPPFVAEKRHFEEEILHAFNRAQLEFDQRRSMGQLGGRPQAGEELQAWSFTFAQITSSLEAALRSQGFQLINPASPQVHLQQQQQQQQQQRPQPQAYNTPSTGDIAMSRRRQRPPQATHHHTASQAQPSPRLRQGSTALLPRPGVIQPQQRVPNPSRFGLHQAHLRSPVLQAMNLSSSVYYFWQGFVRKPQRIMNPNNIIEKLSFKFSDKEMEFVAKPTHTAPGAADGRLIDENHKMLRLRCVKWPINEEPKDDAWAIAENSWIPHSYFTFNDTPLQLRKKLHNGKDLPVDLTGLVRGGENILEVLVMSNASDTTHRDYLVAIEFLGTMTQASIKERCCKNSISAGKTVNDIKRKLSPSETDDDDIAIVESTLTINLRDPFSASKICATPVRGTACLHNECFDLDTFLETRPRKGDVSAADQWRCPICKADARPNVLVVDGFLVEVRDELEKKGLLETRAIIVDKDGSWKPKPEERDPNGVQDRDTPEPTPAAMLTAARPKPPVIHEIIELDSD
ncbi:hypothetical protein BU25DRAFT_410756 [Macroventuria anomochaeta]|uniref:Uncharacterized protein n=1 Tax=Macroventuria anomochaeta TaxID=301207 RepID=A0ACB6S392_9PLEO|nr:uncharacterized protein BU25DRAFT_410756 [Macroventuria anomochaeta]KAF2627607.1 hypothetical protein BU25DRAFT_410756 [Macroventuria anomochaeta]